MATAALTGAPIVIPHSTPTERLARTTFTQLMWALSYPGRRYTLPATNSTLESLATIGMTLLDLETSFFCPESALSSHLARSGARHLDSADAAYHFYPDLATDGANLLDMVAQAATGTLLYPDGAATLIVACKLDVGTTMTWRGPGIHGTTAVRVGGLPPQFWALRASRIVYPLGWDLFLVDGDQVVGLPRTTTIDFDEVAEVNGAAHSMAHREGEA
jgi:alpha-D-ribose 1-methylphosphonate 5-triphosphate synthase subunit PhnH